MRVHWHGGLRWERAAAVGAAAVLFGAPLVAQQPADSAARRQQRALDSLATVIRTLQTSVDSLAGSRPVHQAAAAPQGAGPRGAYMNIGFVGLSDFGWSSESNVRSLQLGDHDPAVRGFTIPNGELTLDGAVDPYFKGFVNLVYKLDSKGETGVELEEMYVLTSSLPANLQVKAGQFFAEFGRENPMHPHAWSFVDQPLILNRVFGPEGLRGPGAKVSWLIPTPCTPRRW